MPPRSQAQIASTAFGVELLEHRVPGKTVREWLSWNPPESRKWKGTTSPGFGSDCGQGSSAPAFLFPSPSSEAGGPRALNTSLPLTWSPKGRQDVQPPQ